MYCEKSKISLNEMLKKYSGVTVSQQKKDEKLRSANSKEPRAREMYR
ncbi:hypothetical protein [uncultured Ruminococcus sp.]